MESPQAAVTLLDSVRFALNSPARIVEAIRSPRGIEPFTLFLQDG